MHTHASTYDAWVRVADDSFFPRVHLVPAGHEPASHLARLGEPILMQPSSEMQSWRSATHRLSGHMIGLDIGQAAIRDGFAAVVVVETVVTVVEITEILFTSVFDMVTAAQEDAKKHKITSIHAIFSFIITYQKEITHIGI
jgi:hypothetical protein